MMGCGASTDPKATDAGEEYVYPSFTSVCQLDNGMGVYCSDLTPNNWAWSWVGLGDNGLQSYYCNQKQCPSKEQCTVQDSGKLLTGICQ